MLLPRALLTPLVLLTAILATLAGCGDDSSSSVEQPTELIVLIDTDLPVPTVVDAVRLEATSPGGDKKVVPLALSGKDADKLPGSLALRYTGGPLGPVRVKAVALHGNTVVVARDAEVSFVEGRTVSFTVSLLASCVSTQCDQGQTCGGDGCRAVSIAQDELGEFDGLPTALNPVDGGPEDFGLDPIPDAGMGEPNTACGDDPCDPLTICTPLAAGGRECGACPSGYEGDGEAGCTDIDECATDNGGCDAAVACRNNVGAPVSCGACPIGFDDDNGDGSSCLDIDECATANGGCGPVDRWSCVNNAGAFATCVDIDECATANGGCDAVFETCTNNAGGAATCVDIDECAANNGGCDAVYESCSDNVGGAPTCVDIDECASNNGGCDAVYETCTDQVGGDPLCTDIDECLVNNGGCDVNAGCTDQNGADPVCTCDSGYTGSGLVCVDEDECQTNNGGCGADLCLNTQGSSVCSAVVSLAGGSEHTCALLSDGTVRCWGRNDQGQLGIAAIGAGNLVYTAGTTVDTITTAVELVAGDRHTCARLSDGTVNCWGHNNRGQLGNNTQPTKGTTPGAVSFIGGSLPKAVALAAGTEHNCAVLEDGSVYCWGRNPLGQLGDGTFNVDRPEPVQVQALPTTCTYVNDVRQQCSTSPAPLAPLEGARAISAGEGHTCVIGSVVTDFATGTPTTDQDMVRCWGENDQGRLGFDPGGNINQGQASMPAGGLPGDRTVDDELLSLALGYDWSCALHASGHVSCFGDNNQGEMGNGTTTANPTAALVPSISTAVELSAGREHVCARLQGGQMQCWGRGNWGQLGDDLLPTFEHLVPLPRNVSGMPNAVMISAHWESSCALDNTGRGYCWGRNNTGQAGVGHNSNLATPTALAKLDDAERLGLGQSFGCALQNDGTVKCWGRGAEGQMADGMTRASNGPTPVAGISTATKVVSGLRHACALLQDRSVVCWGNNTNFQVGTFAGHPAVAVQPIAGLSGAVDDIAAGRDFTCAVIDDGSVQCWGRNNQSQLGDVLNTTDTGTPQTVVGLTDAEQVSSGAEHTCVLRTGGLVSCFGLSNYRQSGANATRIGLTSITIDGVLDVAAFGEASCALVGPAGTLGLQGVHCWGRNHEGQLGPNTAAAFLQLPVYVGLPTAMQISGSGADWTHHTCALLADKTVSCWGNNDWGQLGDANPQNNNNTPQQVVGLAGAESVATGQEYSCATLADGTVKCWGRNNEYQLGNGYNIDQLGPTQMNSLF